MKRQSLASNYHTPTRPRPRSTDTPRSPFCLLTNLQNEHHELQVKAHFPGYPNLGQPAKRGKVYLYPSSWDDDPRLSRLARCLRRV